MGGWFGPRQRVILLPIIPDGFNSALWSSLTAQNCHQVVSSNPSAIFSSPLVTPRSHWSERHDLRMPFVRRGVDPGAQARSSYQQGGKCPILPTSPGAHKAHSTSNRPKGHPKGTSSCVSHFVLCVLGRIPSCRQPSRTCHGMEEQDTGSGESWRPVRTDYRSVGGQGGPRKPEPKTRDFFEKFELIDWPNCYIYERPSKKKVVTAGFWTKSGARLQKVTPRPLWA